jgi:hypothetical protein
VKTIIITSTILGILLIGCGGESARSTSDSVSISSENYINIAKGIYANPDKYQRALPAHANDDPNVIYIQDIIKPRDYKVTKIKANKGDQTITIDIDSANKNAIVSLSHGNKNRGDNRQQSVNMKEFTTQQ